MTGDAEDVPDGLLEPRPHESFARAGIAIDADRFQGSQCAGGNQRHPPAQLWPFLQLIEGDKPDVDVLFARIERDPRHYDISHMDLRFPHRLFDGWSMAFVDMDSDEIAIPGFARRPPSADLHLIDETTAREMLLYFSDRLAVCV